MNNPNNNMNKNRQRGRNNNHKQRPPGRNPNFGGGGGGEQRPRGNAQQLMEKYLQLARDATMQGDRVLSENYFQHADHYYRVLNARFEQQNGQQNNNNNNNNHNNGQRRFHDNGQGQNHDRQVNYNGDQQSYGNEQPRQMDHQPQVHESPSAVYQPQPQPAQQADEDIGLPPGILGNSAPTLAEPAPELETVGAGAEEPRPAQGGRGRRRPRGGDRAASE